MHNDVGAFGTDLVREMGHGVECESRVSLRWYILASVCLCHISIQVKVSMACGGDGIEW